MANIKESKADKLIKRAIKGNDSIHFVCTEGEKVISCIGGAPVRTSITLVCHKNQQANYCYGKIEGKDLFLSDGNKEDQKLRLIFDTNDPEETTCHFKLNDYEVIYCNEYDVTTDGLIIAYVENASFSQLFLYDHSLDHKFISSFAMKPGSKLQLRTIAMSYIGNLYPEIIKLICDEN